MNQTMRNITIWVLVINIEIPNTCETFRAILNKKVCQYISYIFFLYLKKPRQTSYLADNIDLNFVGNLKSHISKTNFSPTNIALGNYNVKQTSTGSNAGFFCTLIEDTHTKFSKFLVVHNWLELYLNWP